MPRALPRPSAAQAGARPRQRRRCARMRGPGQQGARQNDTTHTQRARAVPDTGRGGAEPAPGRLGRDGETAPAPNERALSRKGRGARPPEGRCRPARGGGAAVGGGCGRAGFPRAARVRQRLRLPGGRRSSGDRSRQGVGGEQPLPAALGRSVRLRTVRLEFSMSGLRRRPMSKAERVSLPAPRARRGQWETAGRGARG